MVIHERHCAFRLISFGVFVAVSLNRPVLSADAVSIAPDAIIQKSLVALSRATGANGEDEMHFFKEIIALRRDAEKNPKELIRQLIWYQAHTAKESDFTVVFVLSYVPNLNKLDVVTAIAPFIGRAGDAKIEAAARSILSLIDADSRGGHSGFDYYSSFIREELQRGGMADTPFAAYLFRKYPGESLTSFARATYNDARRKPFMWAEHVVNDWLWKREFGFAPEKVPDSAVTEQVEKMVNRDEWWARLYAAEIVRQHPEFGTPTLVDMLKSDKSELVRKALEPDEKAKP